MLTDTHARKAKGREKPYKLPDGGGLHLYVSPSGGKLWRYRYSIEGREKLLSLGAYPDLSLVGARLARDQARGALKSGRDPGQEKKRRRLIAEQHRTETVEAIGREWHALQKGRWVPHHAADVMISLERDIFPRIGALGVREVTSPEVLALIREIEARGAVETGRRVRQRVSAIMDFAIATGRADINPAAAVRGVLAQTKKGRQPALTTLVEGREILAKVEQTPGHPVTKLAMRLLALTAVRPGALAGTMWSEFDAIDRDNPVWVIPAARMKLRLHLKDDAARDHLVPLSRQALETIDVLRILTGRGPYVLPNIRNAHKTMSENALGYMLNRAGYHGRHVPHGWRSTFSSVLNERFPADRSVIDLMLSHVPKDKVEAAYNRAAHLQRRRELSQTWADLILKERPPAAALLVGLRR